MGELAVGLLQIIHRAAVSVKDGWWLIVYFEDEQVRKGLSADIWLIPGCLWFVAHPEYSLAGGIGFFTYVTCHF